MLRPGWHQGWRPWLIGCGLGEALPKWLWVAFGSESTPGPEGAVVCRGRAPHPRGPPAHRQGACKPPSYRQGLYCGPYWWCACTLIRQGLAIMVLVRTPVRHPCYTSYTVPSTSTHLHPSAIHNTTLTTPPAQQPRKCRVPPCSGQCGAVGAPCATCECGPGILHAHSTAP